ncbi:MAG: 50S ribosomal protein L3 [Candidatus Nanohaloarchaeota archaeon QJJ-9]|nr:50S ribosomal protein L3 [Candidatus Nanohaloarchaeota archaeon QJJ-9]
MAEKSHPRRGSLAYKPQKRSNRLYPTLDAVEDTGEQKVLGFAGYKAGMTRVLRIEDSKNSESKGREVADAVTILECPPLKVFGIRGYEDTVEGKEVLTDIIGDNLHDNLERKIDAPKEGHDPEELEKEKVSEIKLLVHTQPYKAGIGKKKPEVFEMPVGGSVENQIGYAKEKLGGEVSVHDVFDSGEYLDVIGITKGKGWEGAVQRHGVKPMKRKDQKISRKAANLGPWHPDHTSWKVPQAGQTGNVRRTEFNKRLLKIGENPEEVNAEGGFTKYGEVENDYIIVKGSVPGPSKRLTMLRSALRKDSYPKNPEITHIEK